MKDGESESDVRFSMTPFFEVPKIEHRRESVPKGQKDRTKLATKSGQNWPEGPVHNDTTGPKGQFIKIKLARRTSTYERPVYKDQAGPKGQHIRTKTASH